MSNPPFSKPFDTTHRGPIEIDNEPVTNQIGVEIMPLKCIGQFIVRQVPSEHETKTVRTLATSFNTNRTCINEVAELKRDMPERFVITY